jgi:hypothetical protein
LKSTVHRLREEALRLLRENEALEFVISPAGRAGHEAVERTRAAIEAGTKQSLRRYIDGVQQHLREHRRTLGVIASSEDLIAFLEAAEATPRGQVALPFLSDLRSFFKDYALVWPDSKRLPAHARIVLDIHGCGADGAPVRGWRLLEASSYEDMAALWNFVHERAKADTSEAPAPDRKVLHALCRAALAASVYFVEAYVNGLAFDYLAERGDAATDDERSILSDWDFKRDRPRFLSLREKALRYQSIILKTQHAPLQPTNCPELEKVLSVAELIRNPLAHPSPHPNPRSGAPDKEVAIFNIRVETVREAVDSAVVVVRKLDALIYSESMVSSWLFARASSGEFPPETFT